MFLFPQFVAQAQPPKPPVAHPMEQGRAQLNRLLKALNEKPVGEHEISEASAGISGNGPYVEITNDRLRARINPDTGHVRYLIILNRPTAPMPKYLENSARKPDELRATAEWMLRRAGFDPADLKDPVANLESSAFVLRSKDKQFSVPNLAPIEVRLDRMSGSLLSLRIIDRPGRPKPDTSPIKPNDPVPKPFRSFAPVDSAAWHMVDNPVDLPEAVEAVRKEAEMLGMAEEFDPEAAKVGLTGKSPNQTAIVVTPRVKAYYFLNTGKVRNIEFIGLREFPPEVPADAVLKTEAEAFEIAKKSLTDRGFPADLRVEKQIGKDRIQFDLVREKVLGYQGMERASVTVDRVSGKVLELQIYTGDVVYPKSVQLRPMAELRAQAFRENPWMADKLTEELIPKKPDPLGSVVGEWIQWTNGGVKEGRQYAKLTYNVFYRRQSAEVDAEASRVDADPLPSLVVGKQEPSSKDSLHLPATIAVTLVGVFGVGTRLIRRRPRP